MLQSSTLLVFQIAPTLDRCVRSVLKVMRRYASVPYVAGKIRSVPSQGIRRPAADVPKEPARPEPRNQPPSQGSSSFRSVRPEIIASHSTRVERKKNLRNVRNEDIFGLLKDISADLDADEVEAVDDGNDSSTVRDHTPKTSRGREYYAKRGSSLSVLEQLPLSPLMHPRLLKARSRFTKAKPLPSVELNEFQRLINMNPYAQTLATPVRVCILTGVRLPNSFFIPLTLKRDPRTGTLWQVPTGLDDFADQPMTSKGNETVIRREVTELSTGDKEARPTPPARDKGHRLPRGEDLESMSDRNPTKDGGATMSRPEKQESTLAVEKPFNPTAIEALVRPTSGISSVTAHPTPTTLAEHPTSPPSRKIPTASSLNPSHIHEVISTQVSRLERPPAHPPNLQKAYMLSSNAAFSHVSSLPRSQFTRILPFRWKAHFGASLKQSVWREDMADFVLSLLKKRVVKWLLRERDAISISERRAFEMDLPENLAALLWLVDPWEERSGDGTGQGRGTLRNEPPLGAVARMGGRRKGDGHEESDRPDRVGGNAVPVFNLPLLLGPEAMREVWHGRAEYAQRTKSGLLGLAKSPSSAKLVGMLWGLTRYVGDGKAELREWGER